MMAISKRRSMTSVTISILPLPTFRSYLATSHHPLLMAFTYHNLYAMQELAHNTMILQSELDVLQTSWDARDIQKNDWNRPYRNFMVDMRTTFHATIFRCPAYVEMFWNNSPIYFITDIETLPNWLSHWWKSRIGFRFIFKIIPHFYPGFITE